MHVFKLISHYKPKIHVIALMLYSKPKKQAFTLIPSLLQAHMGLRGCTPVPSPPSSNFHRYYLFKKRKVASILYALKNARQPPSLIPFLGQISANEIRILVKNKREIYGLKRMHPLPSMIPERRDITLPIKQPVEKDFSHEL